MASEGIRLVFLKLLKYIQLSAESVVFNFEKQNDFLNFARKDLTVKSQDGFI